MPHLAGNGLSESWILKESGHRHWMAIAGMLGAPTDAIVDVTGERVFPSFVSGAITGAVGRFAENHHARFRQIVTPHHGNGWHSVTELAGENGASVIVDLVSRFVKRAGPSNASLAKADMGPAGASGGDLPFRVRALRARAKAALEAARGEDPPPIVGLPVVAGCDYNEVGLVCFAEFIRFFSRAEAVALPERVARLPVATREIHYFGNADDGDVIDLSCEAHAASVAPELSLTCLVVARRRSDGAVVAVSESCRDGRG